MTELLFMSCFVALSAGSVVSNATIRCRVIVFSAIGTSVTVAGWIVPLILVDFPLGVVVIVLTRMYFSGQDDPRMYFSGQDDPRMYFSGQDDPRRSCCHH